MKSVDDLLPVHRHCELSTRQARADAVGPDTVLAQLRHLLLGRADHTERGGGVRSRQRRGAIVEKLVLAVLNAGSDLALGRAA